MSILLFRVAGPVAEALIQRLLAQGDEVRVVESGAETDPKWEIVGVHVARGDDTDADLIERAAQNVRTAVLFDDRKGSEEVIDPLLEGISAAGVDRLVILTRRADNEWLPKVETAGLDHIVLYLPEPRRFIGSRSSVPPAALAEAIDAADDIAGNPRMRLDLREPASWQALGLEPPD